MKIGNRRLWGWLNSQEHFCMTPKEKKMYRRICRKRLKTICKLIFRYE